MTTGNMDFVSFDDLPEVRPTIPADNYNVRVLGAKIKDSKAGNKYISYDAIVQDGPEAGYRLFSQMVSVEGDMAYQFKRAVKATKVSVPKGLTVLEAAQYFVEQINGKVFLVKVGLKTAQEKDDETGKWVDIPGNFVNQIKGFISPA